MKKKILLSLYTVSVISVSFGLTACSKTTSEAEPTIALIEPTNIAVDTATVDYTDIYQIQTYEGQVNPSITELYFEEDGTFLNYQVNLGDFVKKGDILATSDEEDLDKKIEALIKEQESFLITSEYKKSTLERSYSIATMDLTQMNKDLTDAYEIHHQSFYDTELLRLQITNQEVLIKRLELELQQYNDLNELEVAHYQQSIASLQAKKGTNNIVAPFDGEVLALAKLYPENSIDTTKGVMALGDPKSVVVQSEYLNELKVEDAARITAQIGASTYDISYIPYDPAVLASLQINQETPVSTFSIESTEDLSTLIGQFALVTISSDLTEHALCVPKEAVTNDATGTYVYKIESDIKTRTEVEIGATDGIHTEILNGLEEGDIVYVGN